MTRACQYVNEAICAFLKALVTTAEYFQRGMMHLCPLIMFSMLMCDVSQLFNRPGSLVILYSCLFGLDLMDRGSCRTEAVPSQACSTAQFAQHYSTYIDFPNPGEQQRQTCRSSQSTRSILTHQRMIQSALSILPNVMVRVHENLHTRMIPMC